MTFAMDHFAVNWQDGMKIKSGHFISLENHLNEKVRNSLNISLAKYDYGLLPPGPESASGFKLRCDLVPGNQIKVVLLECRAVTAGGLVIERREDEHHRIAGLSWIEKTHPISENSDKANAKLDVVISADRLARVPVGDPDSKESPPRQPLVSPKYLLKINPPGTPYNTNEELKIAEIVFENGKPKLSERYIPPCSTVSCYSTLLDHYNDLGNRLELFEENNIVVVRNLRSNRAPEGMDSLHRENLRFFATQILLFLSTSLEWYGRIIPHASPLFLVEFFERFARVINTSLKAMEERSRDILLNYFRGLGSGFEPGAFVHDLTECLNKEYDHVDIRSNLLAIHEFFDPLDKLFEFLSKRPFIDIPTGFIENDVEIA